MIRRNSIATAVTAKTLARLAVVLCVLILRAGAPAGAANDLWLPEDWTDGSTLEIVTTDPAGGESRSTHWYVVIQGDVYLRLGTAAADQVERNIKRPYLQVRIDGQNFSDVRADPANDSVGSVDAAMAEKYPFDILFRYLPHPLIVRLRAASF